MALVQDGNLAMPDMLRMAAPRQDYRLIALIASENPVMKLLVSQEIPEIWSSMFLGKPGRFCNLCFLRNMIDVIGSLPHKDRAPILDGNKMAEWDGMGDGEMGRWEIQVGLPPCWNSSS